MTTAAPLRSARANAPPATPVDGFVFEAFEAAFELLSDLLSEDELSEDELSEAELTWLKAELKANRNKPTLIFCHTPLEGTILPDNSENEPRNFTAPAKEIKDILSQNPQVLVWASGHTHTPPTDASFDNAVNHYAGTSVLDV